MTITDGVLCFNADGRADTEFPLRIEMVSDYLRRNDCAIWTGVRIRVRVNEASNNSIVHIHSGWSDPEKGRANFTFGLTGGAGVDEAQARIWYDEDIGDQVEGRYIGGRSGLRIGEYYEFAAVWDGTEVHCSLDGEGIPLEVSVRANGVYGDFLSIDFAPRVSGHLDAELAKVWIQCK